MTNIRNILLIGSTGNGKSTLGNVLVNKNGNFEEVFKESTGSASETNVKEEIFEVPMDKDDGSEKIRYRIINTVEIDNSRLTPYGVLARLAEVAERVKAEGLNQILFVAGGRFTKEEIKICDLLESVIFDKDVLKYTTIVRTRFPDFQVQKACEDDRTALKAENVDLAHILGQVNIIYVDNPPLKGDKEVIEKNKEIREESRNSVISYLVCKPGNYRPNNITLFQIFKEIKKVEEKFSEAIEKLHNKQGLELKEIARRAEEREQAITLEQQQARMQMQQLQAQMQAQQLEARMQMQQLQAQMQAQQLEARMRERR